MALPSFSTPGFHTPRAPIPRTLEVLCISSDSAPSTPGSKSIKRTSSDPSLESDPSPQSLKKQRKEYVAHKENIPQSAQSPDYSSISMITKSSSVTNQHTQHVRSDYSSMSIPPRSIEGYKPESHNDLLLVCFLLQTTKSSN